MMKKMLVNALPVCFRKCAAGGERDFLNSFEKNCVNKCTERYLEIYGGSMQQIMGALPEDDKDRVF